MKNTNTKTIQILNAKTRSLIEQLTKATIHPDGKISFPTIYQGQQYQGFLVCKDACEALKVEPTEATKGNAADDVYYKLNEEKYGKIVEILDIIPERKVYQKRAINPDWYNYHWGNNEGGDGYNPYPKYLDGGDDWYDDRGFAED